MNEKNKATMTFNDMMGIPKRETHNKWFIALSARAQHVLLNSGFPINRQFLMSLYEQGELRKKFKYLKNCGDGTSAEIMGAITGRSECQVRCIKKVIKYKYIFRCRFGHDHISMKVALKCQSRHDKSRLSNSSHQKSYHNVPVPA